MKYLEYGIKYFSRFRLKNVRTNKRLIDYVQVFPFIKFKMNKVCIIHSLNSPRSLIFTFPYFESQLHHSRRVQRINKIFEGHNFSNKNYFQFDKIYYVIKNKDKSYKFFLLKFIIFCNTN